MTKPEPIPCLVCGIPTVNPEGVHGSCTVECKPDCWHRKGTVCACTKYREPVDIDQYYRSEHDEHP